MEYRVFVIEEFNPDGELHKQDIIFATNKEDALLKYEAKTGSRSAGGITFRATPLKLL